MPGDCETATRRAPLHVSGVSTHARDALKLFWRLDPDDISPDGAPTCSSTGDGIDRLIEGTIDMLVLVVDTFT